VCRAGSVLAAVWVDGEVADGAPDQSGAMSDGGWQKWITADGARRWRRRWLLGRRLRPRPVKKCDNKVLFFLKWRRWWWWCLLEGWWWWCLLEGRRALGWRTGGG
jgi:hypothetical protein